MAAEKALTFGVVGIEVAILRPGPRFAFVESVDAFLGEWKKALQEGVGVSTHLLGTTRNNGRYGITEAFLNPSEFASIEAFLADMQFGQNLNRITESVLAYTWAEYKSPGQVLRDASARLGSSKEEWESICRDTVARLRSTKIQTNEYWTWDLSERVAGWPAFDLLGPGEETKLRALLVDGKSVELVDAGYASKPRLFGGPRLVGDRRLKIGKQFVPDATIVARSGGVRSVPDKNWSERKSMEQALERYLGANNA